MASSQDYREEAANLRKDAEAHRSAETASVMREIAPLYERLAARVEQRSGKPI